MPDRLAELHRQRALAEEQLAWFDREIARETGAAAASTAPAGLALRPAASPVAAPAARTMPDDAARSGDEILARYQQDAKSTTRDVKRGCYVYFAVALATLAICAVGAYLVYTRLR